VTIPALDHDDAPATLRRLATPNALALVGDQLLGIVDTIVVGALGTTALAAITGATAVFMVLGIGLFAFGSGLRIVGAQAIGAGQSERFGAIVRASAVVPLGIALVAAISSLMGGRELLHLLLPSEGAAVAGGHYLALRCISLIPMVITGTMITAFATSGDSRLALRVLIVINAVHLPLVPVLALGVLTHHPMGLLGAGISSLISELVGCIYAIDQARRRPELRIFAAWRVESRLVRLTASLGWPEFVFLVLQTLPEPLTVALLAPAGTEAVAAFRALTVVSDVTWALPGSLGDAAEIVMAQRIGARDLAGAARFARSAVRIAILVCGVSGLIVAALAWPLAAVCTLNLTLAGMVALPLAVHIAVTLPLKGWSMAAIAPIRGAGDNRFVMVMGIATTAVALAGIAWGIRGLHLGLWGVPLGWTAAWIARGTITTLRVRNGDWRRRRLATA
jgi:putative MATE family efflux protein